MKAHRYFMLLSLSAFSAVLVLFSLSFSPQLQSFSADEINGK